MSKFRAVCHDTYFEAPQRKTRLEDLYKRGLKGQIHRLPFQFEAKPPICKRRIMLQETRNCLQTNDGFGRCDLRLSSCLTLLCCAGPWAVGRATNFVTHISPLLLLCRTRRALHLTRFRGLSTDLAMTTCEQTTEDNMRRREFCDPMDAWSNCKLEL